MKFLKLRQSFAIFAYQPSVTEAGNCFVKISLHPSWVTWKSCIKKNDQDKLNKFYGFNIYEILLESGPQMITQWYVIFNYMEIFEGKSNIPWTRIEYNKLPWAITSATL